MYHSQPYNLRARIQRLVRLGREKENILEPPAPLGLRLNKLIHAQEHTNLYSQFRAQGPFSSFSGTPITLNRTLGKKL